MAIQIISFTENGIRLSKKVSEILGTEETGLFTKCSCVSDEQFMSGVAYVESSIGEWTKAQMEEKHTLLFIGACGIAVRAIAPGVVNKLKDSAVLVMDEMGQYVIPVLSGHVGGANELAVQISGALGALPVITTATDLNGKFAVDLFAKKNGLFIENKDGIAKVSSKILAGKDIIVWIEDVRRLRGTETPKGICLVDETEQMPDVAISVEKPKNNAMLWLRPKEYILGMGCRRGKEEEKIEDFIERQLLEKGIYKEQIYALASIDRKKDEEGFLAWSRKNNVAFLTFTAEYLEKQSGQFSASSFVKEQVGVDNVCERAALAGAGANGSLLYKKVAEDGMTIAIAKRDWSVSWDEQ